MLNDAEGKGFSEIWNVGDSVGYCTFPNEVLELLKSVGAVSIIGNYDEKVLAFETKRKKWAGKKSAVKYKSFEWTWGNLSEQNKKYLGDLPGEVRMQVEGKEVLLTHGSPANNTEYICTETTGERLDELAGMAKADIVASGHSHKAYTVLNDGTLFVNPGSVGRPEGTGGRASYAILRFCDEGVEVENYQVEYAVEETIAGIKHEGLPEEYARMLVEGKNLQQLAIGSDDPMEKQRAEQLECVIEFAKHCEYEEVHSRQVTKLALRLFDELQELIGMGARERFYLNCAAMMHDIGWLNGKIAHHKAALKMIVKEKSLPFDKYERVIIALIARYHRRALPKKKHEYYCELNNDDKRLVSVLGGLLRIADGLDRGHLNLVKDVKCRVLDNQIVIKLDTIGSVRSELYAAEKKADLLEKIMQKDVIFVHEGI